jgi:hypothetical protein
MDMLLRSSHEVIGLVRYTSVVSVQATRSGTVIIRSRRITPRRIMPLINEIKRLPLILIDKYD